jgi:hypothetical protein
VGNPLAFGADYKIQRGELKVDIARIMAAVPIVKSITVRRIPQGLEAAETGYGFDAFFEDRDGMLSVQPVINARWVESHGEKASDALADKIVSIIKQWLADNPLPAIESKT